MPWLEPLVQWSPPANMQPTAAFGGTHGGAPFLLWTADTTFSLFWLTANLDHVAGVNPLVLFCRQDFSVASGSIEAVADAVMIPDVEPGVGGGGYVRDGQLGPDGSVWLMCGEVGGS